MFVEYYEHHCEVEHADEDDLAHAQSPGHVGEGVEHGVGEGGVLLGHPLVGQGQGYVGYGATKQQHQKGWGKNRRDLK